MFQDFLIKINDIFTIFFKCLGRIGPHSVKKNRKKNLASHGDTISRFFLNIKKCLCTLLKKDLLMEQCQKHQDVMTWNKKLDF